MSFLSYKGEFPPVKYFSVRLRRKCLPTMGINFFQ